jgi:Flp pilus assembly protein TadD
MRGMQGARLWRRDDVLGLEGDAVLSEAAKPAEVAKPAQATDPQAERQKALHEQLVRAEQAMAAKRFHEAIGICQDVLEGNADYPPALALLGAMLGHRGELARGTTLLERAIAKQPNVPAWHSNLSGLYRVQYRTKEAVAVAREAVRLKPDSARFLVNLGKALVDNEEREAALGAFLAALGREADNPEAHLAIGQVLLARGEMTPGWLEYEWRNQLEMAKGMLPKMVAAQWNGMMLPKDRLLLVGDQGYGDTLQFCRFVPMAAARCQEVVVGCSPDLAVLLGKLPGIAKTYSRWNEIPPHKAYCLMSSLPGLFGIQPDTIPARVPYLSPPAEHVKAWAERFAQQTPPGQRRIGVAWSGRPTHPNDRRRSMRITDLAPIGRAEGVTFVSLMQKVRPQDAGDLGTLPGLVDISDGLTDFAQTAAAIANLDLVITIDTAVGHLAGALGRPAWIMLANPSDWRWMLDRADSPWYPTVRLFRQPTPGDWASVVNAVAQELAASARPKRQRRAVLEEART